MTWAHPVYLKRQQGKEVVSPDKRTKQKILDLPEADAHCARDKSVTTYPPPPATSRKIVACQILRGRIGRLNESYSKSFDHVLPRYHAYIAKSKHVGDNIGLAPTVWVGLGVKILSQNGSVNAAGWGIPSVVLRHLKLLAQGKLLTTSNES
jgi:hypothetical protein